MRADLSLAVATEFLPFSLCRLATLLWLAPLGGLMAQSVDIPIAVPSHSSEKVNWPAAVSEVQIPCNDGTAQPAMWYAPPGPWPKPLLVGLHTWGGDFRGKPGPVYAHWCISQGWALVHPHFRGPNETPQALGSERAVADIVESVAWAKRHAAVDGARVYLIGVSGGGHMAMLMAARHPELWAGVSAWSGISDVVGWYAELLPSTESYRDHYLENMRAALGGNPWLSVARRVDAWQRSPLSHLGQAVGVPLDINHGVHDDGVPFTQSLRGFNATVAVGDRLKDEEITAYYRLQKRPADWPMAPPDASYGSRTPLFRKVAGNTRVTIFEGGHEIVYQAALNWLALQRKGQPATWKVRHIVRIEVNDLQ